MMFQMSEAVTNILFFVQNHLKNSAYTYALQYHTPGV